MRFIAHLTWDLSIGHDKHAILQQQRMTKLNDLSGNRAMLLWNQHFSASASRN